MPIITVYTLKRRFPMKKNTKRYLLFSTAAFAGMYAYNRFVATVAANKNMLPTKNGSYYSWKQGNIFYTKTGTGSPILLVHDTNSSSSSVEWTNIIRRLQKNHTVYAIDLLGCGLSDKPGVSYTNYMYVQLITAFIKDIIKEKTDIVASNMSCSFVIMANQIDDSIINNIILINPVSLKTLTYIPDSQSKLKQILINLPLVGTFIYNVLMNPARLDRQFRTNYYFKSNMVSSQIKDAYYEASHSDNSNGKYLYSSLLGNYMGVDIRQALKKLKNKTCIIGSTDIKNNLNTLEEYHKLNSNIQVIHVSNCKLYPQLENPAKINQIIEHILSR